MRLYQEHETGAAQDGRGDFCGGGERWTMAQTRVHIVLARQVNVPR
jgi:translation elongation factor EF-Tu-like GTPase